MPLTLEQQRARVDRLRKEWIDAHGPCAKCGSDDHLEIDHVDPKTKSFTVRFSMGRAKREAELAKCQVLCHDCHLEKTIAERPGVCPEGHPLEMTSQQRRRCVICQRRFNREHMRRKRGERSG